MKSMDLSYDFLVACEDNYDEVNSHIITIELSSEEEKLKFLQAYISESRQKYSSNELYLLNRLAFHVDAMAKRYEQDVDTIKIDFQNPLTR